jgi:hypothetical protein
VSKSKDKIFPPTAKLILNSIFSFAKISLISAHSEAFMDYRETFGIVDVGTPSIDAIQNVVIVDHLEAVITEHFGVMMCHLEGQEDLITCYFEFQDLGVECE